MSDTEDKTYVGATAVGSGYTETKQPSNSLSLKLVTKLLDVEARTGGARQYWFLQGASTVALICAALMYPKYRTISATFALIKLADNLLMLGAVKAVTKDVQSLINDMVKRYPTPQSYLDSILANTPRATDKKDLH